MAIQHSTALRNAMMDAITSVIGGSAILRIYTGAQPADCAAAASGTLLAELTMNATYAPGAANGVLTLNAITQDSSANAGGTAAHYRVYKSDGTTCVEQGAVGTSGSDINLVTTTITAGQPVSITSWTKTCPFA